jgi:hypothetical protein
MRGEIEQAEDDGARWLPAKELDPATYGPMPAFARRGRRLVAESMMVATPVHERTQTHTPIPPRRRYSGPMIGSMSAEATVRYYAPRAAAARAQGHRLEGGVLGPGSFHATCECGVMLAPGELSAVTTTCPMREQR